MITLKIRGYESIDIEKLNVRAYCGMCRKSIPPRSHHLATHISRIVKPIRTHFECFDKHIEDMLNAKKELEQLKTELFAKNL